MRRRKPIKLRKQKANFDRGLLFTVLGLTFIGLVAVADASAPQALNVFGDKYYFIRQQLIWAGVGMAALFISLKINYKFWAKVATPFFIFSLILLILVLIPGIGVKVLGARRWLSLGGFYFQPSELVKLSLAFFLAKLVVTKPASFKYFLPLLLVAVLIMFEPDLGTTLVISLMAMVQIFVSGINLGYFVLVLLTGALATFGLVMISPYRKERLLTFLAQTRDPLGKDYHIRQILLALGSGGIFGVGLGQSRQKFLFLPEAATDSIFAVIAEEIGFAGAVILISIFGFFIYRCLKIARNAPDNFSRILAVGLTTWLGGQTILNLGSNLALVPLTGIPLPFISYGGSSLVMVLSACGILLNISKYATTS